MHEFDAKVFELDQHTLIRLPKNVSQSLPSKGMTLIEGTIDDNPLKVVVEPDGQGSHWFKVDADLLKTINQKNGDTVKLKIQPSNDWPEPKTPKDLMRVLQSDAQSLEVWRDITPMARWDWIRWVDSAKLATTRQKRIDSIRSRFKAGKRRPCCFDRTACTLTDA